MKLESKNIGLFLIAVIGISAGSIYAVMGGLNLESYLSPSQTSGTLMTGHVTAVIHDKAGNIIAYRQADNAIVANGLTILIDQLFNNVTGPNAGAIGSNHTNKTNVNGEGLYTKVGWMSIGNLSIPAPAWNDADLRCALETASTAGCPGSPGQLNTARAGCVRQLAEIDNHTVTAVGAGPNAQINVTAIATFDGLVCNSINIQEAGIWNHPTGNPVTGHMFARNTFGSVTLTTTDSLELTWRFTFTDQ